MSTWSDIRPVGQRAALSALHKHTEQQILQILCEEGEFSLIRSKEINQQAYPAKPRLSKDKSQKMY